MVVTEEIEVSVMKLKVRLLKVSWPGGHQIVVGGRLLSSAKDGVTTPHPDTPTYTQDMFPCSVAAWADGSEPDVSVEVHTSFGMRKIGPVRACTLLFTPRSVRTVTEWLRSQKA